MKKTIYFTLMVMLSITLIGSVSAEEKVKPDNRVASINEEVVKSSNQDAVEDKNMRQRFPAIEPMRKEVGGVFPGGILLTLEACAQCQALELLCCPDSSPYTPALPPGQCRTTYANLDCATACPFNICW